MLRSKTFPTIQWRQLTMLSLLSVMAAFSGALVTLWAQEERPPTRVFEMRTYIAHEGKLEALHQRFRQHTVALFEKHGITNVGYWTPTEGEEAQNTLVYLLAYPSNEEREKCWQAFREDPAWQSAKAESEKNGELVNKVISQMLEPTDYSAIQ